MAYNMNMYNGQQPFNPVQQVPAPQGNFFTGQPSSYTTTQRFNPQQQQLQSQSIQQLMSLLQGGGPSGFGAIEDQARQNFQKKTIPGLAERFSSLGGSPGGSSGFAGLLGEAGSGLETNLAALKGQLGQQQLGQLLPYGFAQSFDTQYFPREAGFLENLLAPLLGGLGQGGGQAGGQALLMKLLPLLL